VWSGRARANLNLDQAKSLESSRDPLIDQQKNNPSEPLSKNKLLHSPLETIKGKGRPEMALYHVVLIARMRFKCVIT
jgi:hypothetical protein